MRKKFVLSEPQSDQLMKMVRTGHKPRVIKQYFKEKWGFNHLPSWKIQGVKRDIKLGRKTKTIRQGKSAKPAPEIKPEGTAQEIKNLVDIMVDNQTAILLDIRLQLIKECNKGFRIRRSIGHDVPDDLK